MSRTKFFRDLGPLPKRAAIGVGHKTDSLLQVLRGLAVKNRREQPRIFYSIREVSARFKVPVSTVAGIYHQLEQEGLVNRVRGSKTILNGLSYSRRSFCGFVALPALLPNFNTIQEYRSFFIGIRHELWLRGFATALVFYREEEANDARLSDRLKAYEVDTVIWLSPLRSARESLFRLSDAGIRVVGISQIGTPGVPSRYYFWKEQAIENLLRHWKDRESVRKITVVLSKSYRSPVTEEIVRLISNDLGFESVVRLLESERSTDFLIALCRLKTDGVIFPCSILASMFAQQSPDEFCELLGAHRVAFVDGPVDVPFAKPTTARVDLVSFDWRSVAESIVNDFVTLEAFDQGRHTTFQAQVQLRVPLAAFSQPIRALRN